MALDSFLKSEAGFTPPKPIDNYPKDSVKKMAVLFTDIVGSSNYFKTHGDIAGRKMLRLHQDLASPVISEFGGALVKVLGDSIMAYFLNPREAVKSAVKIQQSFRNYFKPMKKQDQIHIRIFIHFGDGIVEERDIFGDVVNMAAKFLPFVQGDQIFISQEAYNQVEDLSSLNFVPIKIEHNQEVINGFTVFKVIWDETILLEPDMKTLLYLKPAWNLGLKGFNKVWQSMIRDKRNLWSENRLVIEKVLPDKSVVLILKDVHPVLSYARNVVKFLTLNMGRNASDFLPVQIVIDSGPYLRAGRLHLDDLKIDWQDIEPGAIYISAAVHKNLKAINPSINLNVEESQSQSFYKIIPGDQAIVSKSHRFLYQKALIQGKNPPCFYCGNRKHPTSDCPSKYLTEMTHFTDKLGYLPIDEINNLFFKYLNEAASGGEEGTGPERWIRRNDSTSWAFHGFYELKSVYQLRFFRNVWDLKEENWSRIREGMDDQSKGGLLWIGLDCIRVSNFSQAESIITDALSKKPHDYKIFCMAGFLKVEKSDLLQAQVYFKKALDLARTTPQKILVLFLLHRIYSLNPDEHLNARKMLRTILRFNPFCPEALYLDILHKLQQGNKDVAISQLFKLIKTNRDYYIITLIDPDISDYVEEIHPRLERLLFETKQEAEKIVPEAKGELERLEKLIGKDSKECSEARSLVSKIDEFLRTGSYFGYLDVIHFGESVVNMSRRIIEGRRTRLYKKMVDLRKGVNRCLNKVGQLPQSFMTRSHSQAINNLKQKVDKEGDNIESQDTEEFQNSLKRLDDLSEELANIETKLNRLESIVQAVGFALVFLKKNIIYQSVNLIIGLILFPLITHYIHFLLPESHSIPDNIWYFQKSFIILGALLGIVVASITTKIKSPK